MGFGLVFARRSEESLAGKRKRPASPMPTLAAQSARVEDGAPGTVASC